MESKEQKAEIWRAVSGQNVKKILIIFRILFLEYLNILENIQYSSKHSKFFGTYDQKLWT